MVFLFLPQLFAHYIYCHGLKCELPRHIELYSDMYEVSHWQHGSKAGAANAKGYDYDDISGNRMTGAASASSSRNLVRICRAVGQPGSLIISDFFAYNDRTGKVHIPA